MSDVAVGTGMKTSALVVGEECSMVEETNYHQRRRNTEQ